MLGHDADAPSEEVKLAARMERSVIRAKPSPDYAALHPATVKITGILKREA